MRTYTTEGVRTMECKFMPGDRVCLKDGYEGVRGAAGLEAGRVYVVAEVLLGYISKGYEQPCVRVEGFDYPINLHPHPLSKAGGRKAHLASVFRRVTDISSLQALLVTRSIDELVEG